MSLESQYEAIGVAAIVSAIMLALWRGITLRGPHGAGSGDRAIRRALAWCGASGGEDPQA